MADNLNSNSSNNFNDRPRLKKVKRPINRMMPQAPSGQPTAQTQYQQRSQQAMPNVDKTAETQAQSPNASISNKPAENPFQQASAPIPAKGAADAFDLDAFLDSNEKLPTVNRVPNRSNQAPQFLGSDELDYQSEAIEQEENFDELPQYPLYANKKVLLMFAFLLFFIGLVVGKLVFKDERVIRNGLQGVVVNAEVPRGRARCGLAERNQGCVLYLMNPQRQELNAKDFYDLASQLTGRQRFVIETGNMRYANTKIRPGDIAQINIPPL